MTFRVFLNRVRYLARFFCLLLLFAVSGSLTLAADTPDAATRAKAATQVYDAELAKEIAQLTGRARALLDADQAPSKDALQTMRDLLVDARSRAIKLRDARQPAVDDLRARLENVGPAPEDPTQEPSEITDLREGLEEELNTALVPILRAQDFQKELASLIDEIDDILLNNLSQTLLTRGPSPLLPTSWRTASQEMGAMVSRTIAGGRATLADPAARQEINRKLPLQLFVALLGIGIAVVVRKRLSRIVDRYLATADRPRKRAWGLAFRNGVRLLVPVIGAGLFFGVFLAEPGPSQQSDFVSFSLPGFILFPIAAGWLAASMCSLNARSHRILALDDGQARRCVVLINILGVALALNALLQGLSERSRIGTETLAVLWFPVVLLTAGVLWYLARLLREMVLGLRETHRSAGGDFQSVDIGLRALDILHLAMIVVACITPLLAAAGYLAAARNLIFPFVLSLGLIGASAVVYDLIHATATSVLARMSAIDEQSLNRGLLPVVVTLPIVIVGVPLLAIIWGARVSDLIGLWTGIGQGFQFGDMRFSFGGLLTFLIILGLFVTGTRLIQTLLRHIILPRTKLDAGGRNAITSGFGYLGFLIGLIIAVSAAGFDLSKVAIVAGALSVGIGFGLQAIVSNFVSGLILLFERPIKEGDWIEVAGHEGYVRGINVRSTEIDTFERASVIVPNSDLISGVVLNRTHGNSIGRIIVPIGVSYDADPRHVEKVLMEIAREHPLILVNPGPVILFGEFGDSSLNFEIRCYLSNINDSLKVKSEINFEIARRFREEGIEIPYPHREVYFRSHQGDTPSEPG